MDASLALAPALRTLWLCNNNIGALANLHLAACLTELHLSHNRLTSVALLSQCPGPLQTLHLQVSVHGFCCFQGVGALVQDEAAAEGHAWCLMRMLHHA